MEYDPEAVAKLLVPEMPDLSDWIDQLSQFKQHMDDLVAQGINDGSLAEDEAEEFETVLSIELPSELAIVDSVSAKLPDGLPTSLREFFTSCSAQISFRYAYDLGNRAPDGLPSWIRGGEHPAIPDPIFSIHSLQDYLSDTRAQALELEDFPEDQEIWNRSTPFYRFNNSDYLALDPVIDKEDPFVIYLDHEAEPKLVARNLAELLIEWPRICYVGPGNFYSLQPFIDQASQTISGDTQSAAELRAALKWLA